MKEEKIKRICKEFNISNYSINTDGTIDVEGDVKIVDGKFKKFPLRFGRVSGCFLCYGSYLDSEERLTSLKGCPNYVGGDFSCCANFLTTLEGCPNYVGGDFDCRSNLLTTLEFSPKNVGGDFRSNMNDLISLDGLGKIVGKIYVDANLDLKSFLRNRSIANVLA